MFVLIYAYKHRQNLTVHQIIAETVGTAGSSVALTSTQIILPSVSNFARCYNCCSIKYFTAVLALTACRQKSHYTCCFNDCTLYEPETNPLEVLSPSASDANMPSQTTQTQGNSNSNHIFEPFYNVLIKTHVRVFCLLICVILFAIGFAINQIEVGLPLQETVPKDSYATDHISVEYFLSSPVFLCLYANQQYISDQCVDYLFQSLPALFFKEYITSFDEEHLNVNGLCVKFDNDETNVFYKYPCNNMQCDGYAFQSEDNAFVRNLQSYTQDYPYPQLRQAAHFFHTKYDSYLHRIYIKQKLSKYPLQNSNCSTDKTKIAPTPNITQLESNTYYNRGMYIINANAKPRAPVQNGGAMCNDTTYDVF